jgi:hypothetical protein
LHGLEGAILDVGNTVIGEVDPLDQQQVTEESAVYTRQAVVSQPHYLDGGLPPE